MIWCPYVVVRVARETVRGSPGDLAVRVALKTIDPRVPALEGESAVVEAPRRPVDRGMTAFAVHDPDQSIGV